MSERTNASPCVTLTDMGLPPEQARNLASTAGSIAQAHYDPDWWPHHDLLQARQRHSAAV